MCPKKYDALIRRWTRWRKLILNTNKQLNSYSRVLFFNAFIFYDFQDVWIQVWSRQVFLRCALKQTDLPLTVHFLFWG